MIRISMMMKLLIVLQVLSWWQTFSSSDLLEESPSNQRHCCSGLSSSTDTATANAALTECLEQQVEQDLLLASPQSTGPKLLYVTYYTPAIRDHALFAYAVNSHHASLHGANMHLLSPQTKHDYDRNDQRWNKVKILHDYIKDILLQRSCRQQLASFCQHFEQHPVVEYDYILWLDADLIINNQSFSFNNDVIQKYATADIVLSREINPLNGIANTGSMLVKVSPWTMRFLDIWWDTDAYWTQVSPGQGRLPGSSRIDGMDQHVLDFLYKQYDHLFRTAIVDHPQLSIQDHIVLLEMNAINSEFPGLKTFQEDQPVLHIAGESNFIRRHILRHAWQRLCQQPPEDNMAELLVKKHFLENIDYIALHGEEWNAINEELREVQHNEEATELRNSQVQQWTAMLPKIRYRIREAQQSINKFVCNNKEGSDANTTNATPPQHCVNIQDHFYNVSNSALRSVYSLACRLYTHHKTMSTKGTNRHLLGSLQDVIDAGLEYSLVEQDAEQYLHLLFDLQGDYLVDLQTLVGDSPQVPVDMMKIVYYYRFKVSEFIALHYDRLFLTDRLQAEISPEVRIRVTGRYQDLAIQSYESSKQIWMNMTQQYQYFGTGNHIMNSYQEILLIVKKILHLHCVPSISGRGRDVSLQVLKKLRNEVIKFSLLDAWQMLHLSTETLWKQKKMKSFAQYLSQLEVMAASNDDKDSRGVLPKETIGSMIESVLLMMQCYVMIHVEEPAASSKALLEVIEDLKWLMCTLLHENMNSAEFARCMEKGIPLVHVQDLYPHVGIFTRHLVDLSATSANINKTQEAALNHKKLLLVKGLIIKAMTMKSANEFEASQSEQSKTAKLASNSFPQETKPSNENVKKMKKVKRKDK